MEQDRAKGQPTPAQASDTAMTHEGWDVREALRGAVKAAEEFDSRLRDLFRPSDADSSRRLV